MLKQGLWVKRLLCRCYHIILIFRVRLYMSQGNRMINFEVKSGNIITRIDDCCYGYRMRKATKITLTSFCHK